MRKEIVEMERLGGNWGIWRDWGEIEKFGENRIIEEMKRMGEIWRIWIGKKKRQQSALLVPWLLAHQDQKDVLRHFESIIALIFQTRLVIFRLEKKIPLSCGKG